MFKDETAFARLLEIHGSSLQRFLYFKLPTQEDVDDAFSILCMRLWEYITSTVVEHFSGLAHVIAKAVVAEFYKKRAGKIDVSIDALEAVGMQPSKDPTGSIETGIDVKIAKKAMKQLSEEEQEAILLRHLDGYGVKEIAKYLGKTENATSVLIFRALKKLQKILDPTQE